MSGSTTLRICLAAMAPALTEAASAGLKLQDTPIRDVSSKTEVQQIDKSLKSKSFEPCSQPGLDLNTKSITNFNNFRNQKLVDRKGTQSLVNSKAIYFRTNFNLGDKKPRPVPQNSGKSRYSHSLPNKSITVSSENIASIQLKRGQSITSKESLQFDHFYQVPEDFQIAAGSDKSTHFGNLKIMNQPQIAAEREVNSSQLKTDVKPLLHDNKNTSTAGMVNGDGESFVRKSDDTEGLNGCNERGDADFKVRKFGGVKFKSSNNELIKQSNSMGVYIKEEKTPHLPLGFKSPKFSVKEISIEEKMTEEMRKDCVKKQAHLERKADALLRRLKRMKGKVVETHTKEQLRQFVNYHHRNLQKVAKNIKKETPGPEALKEHFLSNEEVKNMSTAQLVKLVKSYQSNKSLGSLDNSPVQTAVPGSSSAVFMDPSVRIQSSHTSDRLAHRVGTVRSELDSDATASSSGGESGDEDDIPVPQLTADVTLPSLLKRAEWKYAVDRAAVVSRWTWLQAQVSDLEYRIRQQSQVYRQLRNSKGGVVLGEPPTALDLFRRLQGFPARGSTGEGKVSTPASDSSPGTEISPSGSVSAVLSNIDRQALRVTQSLGNCLTPANSTLGSPAGSLISPSPRGQNPTDSPSGSTLNDADTTCENSPVVSTEARLQERFSDLVNQTPLPPSDQTCQAARCRPLRSYRKRKILRTVGLYKSNVKAARLSDIRCRCYPPGGSCPMCGGRYNNVQTIDADSMCFKEKVAILDPSYHPVLSFPQDVHLPIHCEGLLKSGLWQNKPSSRKSRVAEYKRQNVITLISESVPKNGNGKKQNGKNNNTASVINFTAKIKKRYDPKGKKSSTKVKVETAKQQRVKKKKRKAAKLARATLKKQHPELELDDFDEIYLDQEVATPGGPGHRDSLASSSSSLKDHRRKKTVDNSFDINNIVIPLSMATNAIVEQPKYKEIVTPKWREVDDRAEDVKTSLSQQLEKTNGVSLPDEYHSHSPLLSEMADVEDLSDEKFAVRHAQLEHEEKKRHRNYIVYPPTRKCRVRSDAALEEIKNENTDATEGFSESEQSRPTTPMLNKSYPSFSLDDSTDNLQHQLSMSRRRVSCREDLHSHFMSHVEPWPRRTFPLSEKEFCILKTDAPSSCEPVYQRVNPCPRIEPSGKVYVGGLTLVEGVEDVAAAPSPHQSHGSASSVGDDPNDPEWVGGGNDPLGCSSSKKNRHRRIIDDDPNDPEWNGSDHRKKGKNKR